jgi:orotate phosphoribosyltransferase
MAVAPQGWEQTFRELDAVHEHVGEPSPHVPHVATSMSGKHIGGAYFNSDKVTARPDVVRDVITNKWYPQLRRRLIVPTWLVGYRPFSDGLAVAAATEMDAQGAFSDPENGYNIDAQLKPGDTAVAVADDIYTGGALNKTIEQLERRGVRVLGAVLCLANMSGKPNLGDREIIAAAAFEADPRPESECLHCAVGSVALLPRPNWDILQGRSA